jgi:hypothetical protein
MSGFMSMAEVVKKVKHSQPATQLDPDSGCHN